MHLHFLGICGTFMGSLALLAREMGHEVTGSDENVYPPMSTLLEEQGISIHQGFGIEQFNPQPDLVIIGNALSRGNEAVEYVLNKQLPYSSGPQWLSDHLLNKKWVLAVAGTHGKTTTTSMLAWILEDAGYKPGFLIGGVPGNFSCSARLGDSDFFVIEADEYDTAFFDKRSKFIHYHPRTLIMNNLEFDHADIFENIEAIQKQFSHLLRLVPSQGLSIYPEKEKYLEGVVQSGIWSELSRLGFESEVADWQLNILNEDYSAWELLQVESGKVKTRHSIQWNIMGEHNIWNAMAACVAAHHVGVPVEQSLQSLQKFKNPKRRMEKLLEIKSVQGFFIRIFDDFAHHPSAIESTLTGLKKRYPEALNMAILEPRSNTMKSGVHGRKMGDASAQADFAFWYIGNNEALVDQIESENSVCFTSLDEILVQCAKRIEDVQQDVNIVFMSNGGFGGLQQKLLAKINKSNSDD